MLTVFYILVVEQVLQGLHNLWGGLRWLWMAQRRVTRDYGFYTPRVALICPVKGLEPHLEQNLSALCGFDYPDYEVFFAIANADDPARKLLERIAASGGRKVHLVIAGRPQDCSEKVNNLRAAVEQAGTEFEVLVFADSDGRPGRRWLSRLVAPLADEHAGAVTAFRWYLPEGGFWSALGSAWNAPAATYLGEHQHNFCWGGGTAIRRLRFEQIGALEYWRGSVSDDFSLTHALRSAGHPIEFAPECLVPSALKCDAGQLLEFTNRQMIITRVYEPRLWALGGLAHLLYCGTIALGLGLFVANMIGGAPAIHLLLLVMVPPALCMARGVLRLAAVLELLPEFRQRLLAYGWVWCLLAAVAPVLSLWNSVVALFTRRIRWRGVRYDLISAAHTRIVVR